MYLIQILPTGGDLSSENEGETEDGDDGNEDSNKPDYRPSPVPITTTR